MTLGRRLAIAALAGSLAAGLGGCAAPHSSLGTPSSRCFKALPAAERAVHHQGRLLGIRLSSTTKVVKLAQRLGWSAGSVTPSELPGPPASTVRPLCVAAFKGRFNPDQVAGAWAGSTAGSYAVVVVSPSGDGPVRSFVVAHLPVHFHHLV
ncbi:MAG: hypothetical protein ACRD0J_13620 [Acidimicrobiales bacterium]